MTRIEAPWLSSEGAQAVCNLLEGAGYQAWFVGGCVRNTLLAAPVTDLDISTDARPDAVMALAEASGLRAVPTGVDHGTVTVIASGQPFEVTTFRRDVETDGRRAVVSYADTLEEDALRRDFTMNALFVDRHGELRDPVGGLGDLGARRFRFIGEPEARIQEDYLRILRFFRFHAWYGREIDAEGLAACAAHAEGIEQLSSERVTAELLKLLGAPDPARALGAMAQTGVLARVLPGAGIRTLGPFLHLAPRIDPLARLAALGGHTDTLRLSRAEARALEAYRGIMEGAEGAGALGYAHGEDVAIQGLALRAATLELPLEKAELAAARQGAAAIFPIRAADLPEGFEGPAIGAALARLKALWIASGFTLGAGELLRKL